MKCPPISECFVFADDAKLAAQVSCALASPGVYLPVCDGPRLQRPDRDAEVIRRHNAAARARTNTAYMAGLSDESFEATTIVTFLMVFLIQHTQNRDTLALQLKLDELIIATQGARNSMACIEEASEEELEEVKDKVRSQATTERVSAA